MKFKSNNAPERNECDENAENALHANQIMRYSKFHHAPSTCRTVFDIRKQQWQ